MLPLYCLNVAFKISLDLFKPLTPLPVGGGVTFLDGGSDKKKEEKRVIT